MKKQLFLFPLHSTQQNRDLSDNKEFLLNYKTSLLMALLEQKHLTQQQYDHCLKLLNERD